MLPHAVASTISRTSPAGDATPWPYYAQQYFPGNNVRWPLHFSLDREQQKSQANMGYIC